MSNTVDEDAPDQPHRTSDLLGAVALVAIVLVLWACVGFFPQWLFQRTDAGVYGDSFGFVNSLFSGFAFAGIIYAIWLQRKELQLQRQEIRDNRRELKRSADAQTRSEVALGRQAESLLLAAYLNSVNSLRESLRHQIEQTGPDITTIDPRLQQLHTMLEAVTSGLEPMVAEVVKRDRHVDDASKAYILSRRAINEVTKQTHLLRSNFFANATSQDKFDTARYVATEVHDALAGLMNSFEHERVSLKIQTGMLLPAINALAELVRWDLRWQGKAFEMKAQETMREDFWNKWEFVLDRLDDWVDTAAKAWEDLDHTSVW